ncbi:MAG: hypothetical protein ACI9J3_003532 [Parvicellaceae bacterium]|jgi:hypothetical protein
MKIYIFTALIIIFSYTTNAQATLYSQDFEGPDFDTYTLYDGATIAQPFNQVLENYILRTNPNSVPVGNVITGFSGQVIAIEDTDDAGFFGEPFIRTNSFSISGYANISIAIAFAAGSGGDGSYETTDYLGVQYRINGTGLWNQAHRLEGSASGLFYYDALNNGVTGTGDDINVDEAAQVFTQNFTVSGSTMEVRLTFGSQGDHEEMMFDNIIVSAIVPCSDPVISSFSGNPTSICEGDSSEITLVGTLNDANAWYLYQDGCGTTPVDSSISGVFNVNPIVTATYYVRGEDGTGCVNESTISCSNLTVTVNPLPTVNYSNLSDFCIDAGIQTGLNGGTPMGGVYSGTGTIDDGNGSTFSYDPVIAGVGSHFISYSFIDLNGCSNTGIDMITIYALPTVDAGLDQNVCEQDSTLVSGAGASTYSWDNSIINDANFQVVSGATMYTVTGTDINGCSSSDSLFITSNTLPLVNAGIDLTACEGDLLTLNGSNASTYSWNGGVTDGTPFSPSLGTSTYSLIGTDTNGCIGIDSLVVLVNSLPDTSVNQSGNVLSSTNNNATYQWIDCSTGSIISGATNQTFSPTLNGTYGLILTENGCIDTSSCYTLTSVSILENSQLEFVSFPNPTDGLFHLIWPHGQNANVFIADGRGKIVVNQVLNPGENLINLSFLPNGVYHVFSRFNSFYYKKTVFLIK